MQPSLDQSRIRDTTVLVSPDRLIASVTADDRTLSTVSQTRRALRRILHRDDDRLIVVMGPCSIHDPDAGMDYANRLADQRMAFGRDLEIVMRVYFEKPRTTVGWKGLINDPRLDGSCRIEEGLALARQLLIGVNRIGVPAGCEFLDPIIAAYIGDLVSWGAIGARTTESQIHRQLASGLPCPVGFKNGTDGDIRIAIEAVLASSSPHQFPSVSVDGRVVITATTGNDEGHLILRGGQRPNYDAESVARAEAELNRAGLAQRIMIDASHGNTGKDPGKQPAVIEAIAAQVAAGGRSVVGVMVESHIVGGRQDLTAAGPLTYGQSITDGCIDWTTSVEALRVLAEAVQRRRKTSGRLGAVA